MLSSCSLVAFVATRDGAAAMKFYRDALGLRLVSEDAFALVFDAGGTMLRVTKVKEFVAAPYTVLGWRVDDIGAAVRELAGRGVRFERFDGMPQDEAGIWNAPSGAWVAWFKDPDGNVLSVAQMPR